MNLSTQPSVLWQKNKVQSLPAQYIPNCRLLLRSPTKRRWLLLDFIAWTEKQCWSLVEKGQKPLKTPQNLIEKSSLSRVTFSDYSHSHRSASLPRNVHIQTLSTKFCLFNLCSSNRNISTTISSLSTYSKQGLIIIIMLFSWNIPFKEGFEEVCPD